MQVASIEQLRDSRRAAAAARAWRQSLLPRTVKTSPRRRRLKWVSNAYITSRLTACSIAFPAFDSNSTRTESFVIIRLDRGPARRVDGSKRVN